MTTATAKKSGHNWRVADIVVAALIAVAGGVIFWAWSHGAIIAGALSWIATRGLAKTGVLSSFASRKAATEPVLS